MKPVKFEQHNIVLGEGQEQYQDLPALKMDTETGDMVTCWKLTWREKLKFLITGKLWLNVVTFDKPFPPVLLSVYRMDMFMLPEDNKNEIKSAKARQVKTGLSTE